MTFSWLCTLNYRDKQEGDYPNFREEKGDLVQCTAEK